MTDHIRIRRAGGTWVIRADGAQLGESRAALEMTEDGHPPVIYFPREDLAMAMMDRSTRSSFCATKGEASYCSIVTPAGTIRDAAWSYEAPKPGVAGIAGHLAFYPDKVTIERL